MNNRFCRFCDRKDRVTAPRERSKALCLAR